MSRSQAESALSRHVQTYWTAHALGETANKDYACQRLCKMLLDYGSWKYGQQIDTGFSFPQEYEDFLSAPTADSRKRIADRVAGLLLDGIDSKAAAAGLHSRMQSGQGAQRGRPSLSDIPAAVWAIWAIGAALLFLLYCAG